MIKCRRKRREGKEIGKGGRRAGKKGQNEGRRKGRKETEGIGEGEMGRKNGRM